MTSAVNYSLHDRIGIITVNNAPVNALSQAVREGLLVALDTAAHDNSDAVILCCAGRTFIAGADITEFGKPPREPSLHEVLERLDSHPKLTIAAIHGTALGGGLETALTCHYRVALSSAKLGLPEVKLGLLPGAGGTQRLPRLVGINAAIQMITLGSPVSASQAVAWSLIDSLIEGDLMHGATEFALKLINEKAPRKQTRAITLSLSNEDRTALAAAREQLAIKSRGETAPQRILDCIEAAAGPDFESGISRERELFMACMTDPQSAAMRHMFFAERAAAKVEGINSTDQILNITQVGIVGAGTMGGGIAMCFAQAGIPVTLVDMSDEAVKAGIDKIAGNYALSVKRGRLDQEQVATIMANITPSSQYKDLAQADLVIEAVFENLAIKQEVFKTLDTLCKPGAILASNTSYQSIDDIAAVTSRPEWVLGMHFFSPANVMKLLEVVRGAKSSDSVISTAMHLGKIIGKVPVLSGMCYGFIGNRMLKPYAREAALCLMEGATPAQIDGAMERWGMAMGPLAVGDLAGLDIGYKAREQLSDEQKGERASYIVADRLVEAGRLGQKTGAGYYQYDSATRKRLDDPAVMTIVEEACEELGITRRSIADEEIVDRLTLALANEGAKLLSEGIAQRASDIDVVYCYGYGFPRFRGGPMHAVEAMGLEKAVARMKTFAQELNTQNWQIAGLLEECLANNVSLNEYSR